MTISFSYAYWKGLDHRIVSSPYVQIAVHPSTELRDVSLARLPADVRFSVRARDQRTVHEDRLGDVVCIVARNDVIHAKSGGAAVERLSAEDTT